MIATDELLGRGRCPMCRGEIHYHYDGPSKPIRAECAECGRRYNREDIAQAKERLSNDPIR